MSGESIGKRAEEFGETDILVITDEWRQKAEPALRAWLQHNERADESHRLHDVFWRGALAEKEGGITKNEAHFLQNAYEEGLKILEGQRLTEKTKDQAKPKGWWQRAQLPDGRIVEKVSSVPAEIVSVETQSDTSEESTSNESQNIRERWTPRERKLIYQGMRALQSKDESGLRFADRISATLRQEGLVINELSFFRPHGPYSMMMPDTHEVMMDLVREYRVLPIAADESKQDDANRIQDLIERAKRGDLSPNQFTELEVDIERIRDAIKEQKRAAGEVIEELPEDIVVEDAVEAGQKKQRKQVNVRWKEKWDKVQLKNKWKKEWEKKRDATKEWSDFTERFMVLFIAKLGWGGEGVIARVPAETDDVFHATDGIVRMDRELIDEDGRGERVKQTYTFDTTDSVEEGIQKTANTLRFIDLALLTTLEFAQTYDDQGNVEVEGMQTLVPRLNYVISRPLAAEMAILLKNNRKEDRDMLALHPAQLMILRQAQAQIAAYMAYIETEYRNDRRREDNKAQIIAAFARLRDLIDAAAEEREDVLREEFDDLSRAREERALSEDEQQIFAMLLKGSVLWSDHDKYGAEYDSEHGKYIRAFKPDTADEFINDTKGRRTRAWWRMTALVEKYPAVRTEEDPSGEKMKKPVPVPDKRRGPLFDKRMRTRARFRKGVGTKRVVNSPASEGAEA